MNKIGEKVACLSIETLLSFEIFINLNFPNLISKEGVFFKIGFILKLKINYYFRKEIDLKSVISELPDIATR